MVEVITPHIDAPESVMPLWQRIILPFFMERKNGVFSASMGMLSWWITLGAAMYVWLYLDKEIKDNHFWLLTILAGYNFGKKVLDKIKSKISPPTIPIK